MSISIKCKLSLSKKLRAIIEKDSSLTLISNDIKDGKGIGTLIIDSVANINIDDIGETSIMLTPSEISDEIIDNESLVHSSIFSTPISNEESPLVQKIAVVKAPEKGQESVAIKKNIPVPSMLPKQLKNPECKKWISNMEELIYATISAKNKKSNLDISVAKNDREKAIIMEQIEKDESFDTPAWIVNKKSGVVSINDLGISLPLNVPYNLGNISAKRVSSSRDLKSLIENGFVDFISPTEKDEMVSIEKEGDISVPTLPVFDNHDQALSNMSRDLTEIKQVISGDQDTIDIPEVTDENAEEQTEEESMILDLTQKMSPVKNKNETDMTRKTVHGNNISISSRSPAQNEEKSPSVKSIQKKF